MPDNSSIRISPAYSAFQVQVGDPFGTWHSPPGSLMLQATSFSLATLRGCDGHRPGKE